MNLLAISGSLRAGSFNTLLVREAASVFAPSSVTHADLRMPLYDGDLEAESGLPAEAQTLIAQIRAADAIVIATPEYNHAPPGVLKNALDWVSRDRPMAFAGKAVSLLTASAGRGGPRAQAMLRLMLYPLGAQVATGPDVFVGPTSQAFEDGKLVDEGAQKFLRLNMEALKALATTLKG